MTCDACNRPLTLAEGYVVRPRERRTLCAGCAHAGLRSAHERRRDSAVLGGEARARRGEAWRIWNGDPEHDLRQIEAQVRGRHD